MKVELAKLGHEVRVVMTKDAQEFITPLTLQVLSRQPVNTGLYDEKEAWRPGHIETCILEADVKSPGTREEAEYSVCPRTSVPRP